MAMHHYREVASFFSMNLRRQRRRHGQGAAAAERVGRRGRNASPDDLPSGALLFAEALAAAKRHFDGLCDAVVRRQPGVQGRVDARVRHRSTFR